MLINDKILVDHLEIVTEKTSMNKPYYSLKYHEVNGEWCLGYSSYSLPIVLAYIIEYFLIKW